jgi:hypothetical protein
MLPSLKQKNNFGIGEYCLPVNYIKPLAIAVRALFNEKFVHISIIYPKDKPCTLTSCANFHTTDTLDGCILYKNILVHPSF